MRRRRPRARRRRRPTAPPTADPYGTAPTQAYDAEPGEGQAAPAPPYAAAPTAAPYGANPGEYAAPGSYSSPQPYGAPTTYAPPRPPQSADAKPSVLGLVALGVAVIGFVLSFIPIATIGGWVLLPLALVLAIVAFFLQGRKWPAIAALVVAVVGGIVAIVMAVVFAFLAFGAAVSNLPDIPDLPGGGESTVEPPTDDSGSDDSGSDDSGSDDGTLGTVENPAPIGSTISGEEYDVVINSVTLNADDEVLAASAINGPPGDGRSWAIVNATYTYTGSESGLGLLVFIGFLASDGTEYDSSDPYAVPPEPNVSFAELNPGEPVTGNIVLAIPTDADGVLRVQPGILDDPIYVALR